MQNRKVAKKIITLGFYDSGTGKHQSNTVYSSIGNIPAITTITGGTQQIKVLKWIKRSSESDKQVTKEVKPVQ